MLHRPRRRPPVSPRLPVALALLGLAPPALAHDADLPAGFYAEEVVTGWNQPTDMAFLADGRLLVAEKAGRLWMVDGGVKGAQPVLDISEEVGNGNSRGLKSFALDPDFMNNGHVYLLYEVDRHYLFFFGTPQYDPQVNDVQGPTIGRISRLTLDPGLDFQSVVPGSRTVLLGESVSTGFPVVNTHETGCIRFGDDGSLLASCGDGAGGLPDFGGEPTTLPAIMEGILTVEEDVGPFRAQQIDSFSGNLVRIDPATGDGLPSNPYFDAGQPRSARSRTWSRGFRNPFRFGAVPGTSSGPGHPGTIVIGDVGRTGWEEVSLSLNGGENFGWPIFEGMEELPDFANVPLANPFVPNPLFGQDIPGVGVCTEEFFTFQELLVQETQNVPEWPNPCDPLQSVPATSNRSVHTRPIFDWPHIGEARAADFDAQGNAITVPLADPQSPISGSPFEGSCVIAGTWYESGPYPTEFEGSFFIADYAASWIKRVDLHNGMHPHAVEDFAEGVGAVVSMDVHPQTGELYYLLISTPEVMGSLIRVGYAPGDVPPTAVAYRAPVYAPSPMTVQFDASDSSDPEARGLVYSWDFGDGTPTSALEKPLHVFPSEDVSDTASPTSQVLTLVPPQTINTGPGFIPAVVNDGVFVDPTTAVFGQTYVTLYDGDPANDPDPEDWVGLELAAEETIHQVVFQEGREEADFGGWFEDLTVDVRQGGVWTEVTGLTVSPPYDGKDGVPYEVHELLFDAVQGDAVRLRGTPGGTFGFVSVAELRAITRPPLPPTPTRWDVTLTVEDGVNNTSVATTTVWTDNTPPTAAILGPVNGDTYDPLASQVVTLDSVRADAESAEGQLDCEWLVTLHHNDHTHPEPIDTSCTSSVLIGAHGLPDEVYYWEFKLTVRDPQGLGSSVTSVLYPEPPSLLADRYSVSMLEGGTTSFQLRADPALAGGTYWIFMTASGVFPGVDFETALLPLNYDPAFKLTATRPFLNIFTGFLGTLDGNAEATAQFTVPPGSDPSLSGVLLHFAYIAGASFGDVDFASNPTQLRFGE